MSSDVKWPRRAVCKRFGYEVEQASAGAKWVVTNRLPVPSSVVIGDSWSDVDGEGFLKFKIWEEVLKPFDLSTLDTAGVFHVEAGATQLANDLAEMGFSMEAVKPAPVETPAPSQPADVPQWCRDAAKVFFDDYSKNEISFTESALAAIIARHAAPVFKELALKRDEYIDVLRKQVDASAAELTTLRERLAGAEELRKAESKVYRESLDACQVLAESILTTAHLATVDEDIKRCAQEIANECRKHVDPLYVGRVATQDFEIEHVRSRLAVVTAERDEALRKLRDWMDTADALYRAFPEAYQRGQLPENAKRTPSDMVREELTALRAELARARDALIHIGSFFGCSAHLPWFSDDACDEVSAIIDAYGGEKHYDPAFYETYCAQVIADIVTGALSASASGEEADNAELR